MDVDKFAGVDDQYVATQLGILQRSIDHHDLAVGTLAWVQKLDDVVIGAGNVGAGGMTVCAVEQLQTGAIHVGGVQAHLVGAVLVLPNA